MTDKKIIREQANIDISNLHIAQEQGIITEFGKGKLEALEGIVDFIDSMQEKPVSEDLEEASYRFACKCNPLKTEYSTTSPNPEVIKAFKAGAEWKERDIDKRYHRNRYDCEIDIKLKEKHEREKVLEKFRELLLQKRNEYIAKMNEYGSDSYYDYCRGKKDLIEDIIAYLANELNDKIVEILMDHDGITEEDAIKATEDFEIEQRMKECPYKQVGCTMYEGKILECRGACSWVVDYPKLKELKARERK